MGRPSARQENAQARGDRGRLPIARVGVKDIQHPAVVKDRSGGEQRTLARFNLYAGLPREFEGHQLSRFHEILNSHGSVISVRSFHEMLFEIYDRLEAQSSHIEMRFPYFMNKSASFSGAQIPLDYSVMFAGQLDEHKLQVSVGVEVPVIWLCPHSKENLDSGAYSRRSKISLTARIGKLIWIEELIEMVEQEARLSLYDFFRLPSEQHAAAKLYDGSGIMEEIARGVAARLDAEERVTAYTVKSEESAPPLMHSAYAFLEKEKTRHPEG